MIAIQQKKEEKEKKLSNMNKSHRVETYVITISDRKFFGYVEKKKKNNIIRKNVAFLVLFCLVFVPSRQVLCLLAFSTQLLPLIIRAIDFGRVIIAHAGTNQLVSE